MEKEVVHSVEIAKTTFEIREEALSLLNKKPRVSRNVLQAYHREIMTIAKSLKQLFLDIAKRKEDYERALLELESSLQTEKTEREQEYMDISSRIDELKKAIDLGISDTRNLREENSQLEDSIKDSGERIHAIQNVYEERIAALSLLHSQLELARSDIEALKEEEGKQEALRNERRGSLEAEEKGIENCAENLEAAYSKRHAELSACVETDRSSLSALQEEYPVDEEFDKVIASLSQRIGQAEEEWSTQGKQKGEVLVRECAVRAALEQAKGVLAELQAQEARAAQEARESAKQFEAQGRQKAELDAYYDDKLEAARMEKKTIYDRVVAAEVENTQLEGEKKRLVKAAARAEEECRAEEEKKRLADQRTEEAEREFQEGSEVLTNGASEVLSMAESIRHLEEEIARLRRTKDARNREMTAELEALTETCEEAEDKVGVEGKGRNEEKARVNGALRARESEYAALQAANTKLQTEYQNAVDMKNSTKESSRTRTTSLREELAACQHALRQSDAVDDLFASRQARLKTLQEKVNRSEKARRVLSDKIQTIRGNVVAELRVMEMDPSGRFVLDETPDERSVSITGNGFRSSSFHYERVFWGNCGLEEIGASLGDTLYSVLDGKTITLLNVGTQEVACAKRQFIIQNSPNCLFYHIIASLLKQTSRLASLAQHYQFFVSAVEIDAREAGRHFQVDNQDMSVGESYIDDEPVIRDLFEIGRFSSEFNTEAVEKLKRREVRKEEDLIDILSILCHQRASLLADPMKSSNPFTLIVTITVEGGEDNGQLTAGQIHLCDIAPCDCESSSQTPFSLYQECLIGLIPALDRLCYDASSQGSDSVASDISSLTALLSRLSNRGKIIVLNNLNAAMTDYGETLDVLGFVQCIGNCKLGQAQSRLL